MPRSTSTDGIAYADVVVKVDGSGSECDLEDRLATGRRWLFPVGGISISGNSLETGDRGIEICAGRPGCVLCVLDVFVNIFARKVMDALNACSKSLTLL